MQFKGVHTGWMLGSPRCALRAPDICSIHIPAADPSVHQVLRQAQAKTLFLNDSELYKSKTWASELTRQSGRKGVGKCSFPELRQGCKAVL